MQRKTKKKSLLSRPVFWIILLLVVASFAAGWYVRHFRNTLSPHFEYFLISVNQEQRKIVAGKTTRLHPADRVRIQQVATNVPLNFRIRLVSEGIDAEALQFEEMRLSDLLPHKEMFDHYRFRVRVKYRNKDLGYSDWEVRPYPADWLDEADRILETERRIVFLARARELLPEDDRIRQRLLTEYKAAGRPAQAAAMLEEGLSKNVSRERLSGLLELYRAMSAEDRIISVLRRIVSLDPDDLDARIELAERLEKQGGEDESIKQYQEILKRVGPAEQLILCKQLAYMYTESGRFDKAVKYYLKAAELDDGDANLYYNISYLYEKLGEREKADNYLAKALDLKSDDTESRLKLARKRVEEGRLKDARQYLREVLEREPRLLSAWVMMADILDKMKDKQGLMAAYEQILAIDPENETVIYNLAVMQYEAGDLKKSLPHFKKYLEFRPEDVSVHSILFHIYKTLKNAPLAFKQAQILIELKPNELELYHYMFQYLSSKGAYGQMIPLMKRGVERHPLSADLKEYLVVAYLKTGDESRAMAQMEKLVKLKPRDADLWLHLARLREKRGRLKGALEAYGRVVELSPGHEEAEEAYLQLRLKGIGSDG
ncbi:MAG: tetratricopeptide repeat protein [Deltaproteobacteria bacterium]|nr:tetratricopeptide repeat protein [Deltaproteobacteria bacterium]MBW2284000.1 tetratricopeptide repeat protein [Deltaproteobacteria bacterium]